MTTQVTELPRPPVRVAKELLANSAFLLARLGYAFKAKAIAEVLKIANEDVPYAPLWWEDAAMAISGKYRYTGFNGLYYLDQWPRNIRAA